MLNIKEELSKLSDNNYKKFNQKLCPDTQRKMLGIRVPQLRKLAKEILKEYSVDEVWKNIDDEYFEEIMLQGIVIGYAKLNFEEKKKYIQKFIPKIDSWAICDTFVPSLKIRKKDLDVVWDFILPYTKSNEEFDIRFSVIMMLDYFITEEYVDNVLKEIDKITHDGYYVKMGIAWLVAEIAIKFYDRAINYLKNNNLDNFTHNKAIQKMIESHRIADEQKDFLRTLKRK